MRVVHIAYTDTAGSPGRWAMADQRIGEKVKLVVEVPHPFRYRCSVHTRTVRWSNGNQPLAKRAYPISDHVMEADRLVVYEHPDYVKLARAAGKPYCFHALGTASVKHAEEILKMCEEDNAPAFADTHELVAKGFEFMGSPVFTEAYPPLVPHDGFTVAHAPTNRDMKGTRLVEEACRDLDVKLDVIEGVTSAACVYRKAVCDVLVDQVSDGSTRRRRLNGYGVNGLEAMAMRQPVIGWAGDEVTKLQQKLGMLPYLHTNGDVKGAIKSMMNPELREHMADVAEGYLHEHHEPEIQAQKVWDACS